MALLLYNKLTQQKEVFTPLNPEKVGMYVCGPTVYDLAHLGNARPAVVFDVLYRLLKVLFPQVIYVRNITDLDDKINQASEQQGIAIKELTTKMTAAYHTDVAALGSLRPDYEPRATEHIDLMIKMIEELLAVGIAYQVEGHVLFAISNYANYGNLSRRNLGEMIAGARVEIAPYKKNPADFVLWKPSQTNQPGWQSPWGVGRPGWHIECSAMSTNYLGKTFDIHGGGIDLIFPHHENEIAQSCGANHNDKMANYWLHNGHITVDGRKMSKSLGNFLTIRDTLTTNRGETIRLALLMSHYRQPLDWQPHLLTQAKQTLDRWYGLLALAAEELGLAELPPEELNGEIFNDFIENHAISTALKDDLNIPKAIAEIHALVNLGYKTSNPTNRATILQQIRFGAAILGLLPGNAKDWLRGGGAYANRQGEQIITEAEINKLIAERQQAKHERDFAKADSIRQHLIHHGIHLEDGPLKTLWRRC